MINNKKDLKRVINYEKTQYLTSFKRHLKLMLLKDHDYLVWTYLKALRYMEYHQNTKHYIRAFYWERKRNKIGSKYGLFVWPNCAEEGLKIWHYGDIIIHKQAKIGKNCQLHGMNCIGNKGVPNSGVPTIGNDVNIGVGAVVIGDVYIADGVSIGANAVVTKSCYEKNALLIGAPARIVSLNKE